MPRVDRAKLTLSVTFMLVKGFFADLKRDGFREMRVGTIAASAGS
jgi:hypothetical protein